MLLTVKRFRKYSVVCSSLNPIVFLPHNYSYFIAVALSPAIFENALWDCKSCFTASDDVFSAALSTEINRRTCFCNFTSASRILAIQKISDIFSRRLKSACSSILWKQMLQYGRKGRWDRGDFWKRWRSRRFYFVCSTVWVVTSVDNRLE
jgi:hypothetical protein